MGSEKYSPSGVYTPYRRVEKPCQKTGEFDRDPAADHGFCDDFVNEAKGCGTRVAVELALESARRLRDIPIRLARAALTDRYAG